ncbi:hypothetical protein [Christiangramia salexigens]|nr:hypothetical protein [Christiangramia salexigens]
MKNSRLLIIMLIATTLLLIPLVAMQFTSEVNWTLSDFLVAAVLLFSTGLLCELALRKTRKIKYRLFICVAILVIFLLTWAELAVGIFGTPFSGS